MRYFIHLAYKGTNYSGWQRQRGGLITIQQTLEDALSKMLNCKALVHGCGRTDAGVHASQYYCHLDIPKPMDFDPVYRLNKMLPADISVFEFIHVGPCVNAQIDALNRSYIYKFHLIKNPFLSEFSFWYDKDDLDIDKMKEAAALIVQQSDFQSMCKSPDQYSSNTICKMEELKVEKIGVHEYQITITANRFLQAMVRIIVARMFDIGAGKMNLKELEYCFQSGDRPKYLNMAYPLGLSLAQVRYPFIKA